jgi:cobalt-zinc-cadmium efflux system membrane fusion protein
MSKRQFETALIGASMTQKKPFFSTKSRTISGVSSFLLALSMASLLQGCGSDVKIPEVPSRTELPNMAPSKVVLTSAQEQNLGIQTEAVGPQHLSDTLQTTGKVQAINNLMGHSFSPATGQAVTVPVSVGKYIQQGQVLAWVRSDQIGQLEADLLQQALQNTADIQQAKVQLNLSKAVYQRENRLFADKISSRADLETAQAQYEKDRATVDALRSKEQSLITSFQSRLSLYGAPATTAIQVIRQRKLSPFISIRASKSGILIARNVNPGELVDTSKELFTIADLTRVWLVGDIYEKDLEKIQLKQPVSVTLDSISNRTFDGRVTFIDAMLDPQARTLEIRSEVHNDQHLLKPNMFARVAISVGEKNVLSVPNTALQRNGDNLYVYVPLGNHIYEERKIGTGLVNGSHTEVTSGLKEGDKVVTHGSLQLKGEVLKESAKSD